MSNNNRIAVYTKMAEDELYLNSTCLIAYCDLNASGLRALLGIDARCEFWELEVPGLPSSTLLPLACDRWEQTPPVEAEFRALQVLNLKYEQYSLLLVNSPVPGSRVQLVVDRIFQLLQRFKVQRVHLLSCLHLPELTGRADLDEDEDDDDLSGGGLPLNETVFNSGARLSKDLPSLDTAKVRVRDPFLCCFIQFAIVDQLPFSLLTVASHRITGRPDAGAVAAFQQLLADRLGLAFSLQKSLGLRFHRVPGAAGDSGMYV